MSHPNGWSDEAKHATQRAVERAFGSRVRDSVNLVSESEAVAIAALTEYKDRGYGCPIKQNQTVLVYDCGGGTVDATTYLVKKTDPELEFIELAVSQGGMCGSTYVDRAFWEWMEEKFGEASRNIQFEKKGPGSRLMKEFEAFKHRFAPKGQSEDELEIHLYMPRVKSSNFYNAEEKIVLLNRADMESFFTPVIETIVRLLDYQLSQIV